MTLLTLDHPDDLFQLRSLDPEKDCDTLLRIGNSIDIARMMATIRHPWSEQDARTWIHQGTFTGTLGYKLGVFVPGTGLLGVVGINGPIPSISVFVDPSKVRRGFASQACILALQDAVKRFNIASFHCDVFEDNIASIRLFEKLDFTRVARLEGRSLAREGAFPIIRYHISHQKILNFKLHSRKSETF